MAARPLVPVPELGLLEMLSDVGVRQGVEEARNIMEGVRSLRPKVLATLLKLSAGQSHPTLRRMKICSNHPPELAKREGRGEGSRQ